ncbi:hypothetical protein QAD02_019690 [Eretmocerus hayati]|uniref:Uncharacterized protein n=1 Tax=Eretmocerus hayati TaxID=131215 RepID=A0ACC2PLE2_9HYME|nr:hypothetical protein QAD02_019690 [Eretmocerus hayati]
MFPEDLECNASDVAYIAKDCLIGNLQNSACMEWGDIDDDLTVLSLPAYTAPDLEDACNFVKKNDDHVPEKTFNDYGGLLYEDQCLTDGCAAIDFDADDLDFHNSRIGQNFSSNRGQSSDALSTYTSLDELIDLENDLSSLSRDNASVSQRDGTSDPFFEEEDLGFQVPNLFDNELADSIMMIDDDFLNDVTQSSDVLNGDKTIIVEDDSFLWIDSDAGRRKQNDESKIDDLYLREAFFIKTGIRINDVRVVLKRLCPILVVKSKVAIDDPNARDVKPNVQNHGENGLFGRVNKNGIENAKSAGQLGSNLNVPYVKSHLTEKVPLTNTFLRAFTSTLIKGLNAVSYRLEIDT